MEENVQSKAIKAITRYLERRDFEILEQNWAHGNDTIDFIAREDDALVFISTKVTTKDTGNFSEKPVDRKAFERLATAYIASNQDMPEGTVRMDTITLMALGDSKAFLKHHRNALSDWTN